MILALALALTLSQPVERGAEFTCSRVERVIDGDTFQACGETIRLADIDTPELRGRCEYERRQAIRARSRLIELLSEPFGLVRSGRATDRYGRQLRVVVRLRDRRSVGDILVSEDLARTWSGRREPWC